MSQVRGRVGLGVGEVVKRRESLIPAWKVRGPGVRAQPIVPVGANEQYIL